MTNIVPLAQLDPGSNLSRYLLEIQKFPMLTADEEFTLAKRWRDDGDVAAAHELVTSHLRLVAKIAMGYRGYGLPLADLIAEGNIGMMQAVKKFDPDKGFRLATYAIWWIKAQIQEYVLHSWSLVKIGTTAAQKKLFFNLRRLKGQLQAIDDGDMSAEQVSAIAKNLDVAETEVVEMNRRLSGGGDQSLNANLGDGDSEWQDWLESSSETEQAVIQADERSKREALLLQAIKQLNPREQQIIVARRLSEPALTLEQLATQLGVSRERVRQIEAKAYEKLQDYIRNEALHRGLITSY